MNDDEEFLLSGPEPPEPRQGVRADVLQRTDKAWLCRIAGGTWAEAASVAGYSDDSHAIRAVRTAYGELPSLDRNELRRLWRDRLERSWRQVVGDMADRVPGATTASVRIATAAIALDGLAEPAKLDVRVTDLLESFAQEMADAGLG